MSIAGCKGLFLCKLQPLSWRRRKLYHTGGGGGGGCGIGLRIAGSEASAVKKNVSVLSSTIAGLRDHGRHAFSISIASRSPYLRRKYCHEARAGDGRGRGGRGPAPAVAPAESGSMAKPWAIYFYVPNLIGYARILSNLVAFGVSFTNKKLFVVLYLVSFICDELDGRFAHMLNQTSTFGAVLDMVTDRVSTAGLLVVLSHYYKSCFGLFLGLLALDISSHWLHMYSTSLSSKTSHKDMGDSRSMLLRAYYKHRYFMGYCCVGAEVLYLILYMLAENQFDSVIEVVKAVFARRSPWIILGCLALPGWAIKQWVNLAQIWTAADVCVTYDHQKSEC